jgi:hypothetical protein
MAAILYRTTATLIPDAAIPTMSVGDGGGLLIPIRTIMPGKNLIGLIVTMPNIMKIMNQSRIGIMTSQVNRTTKNPVSL